MALPSRAAEVYGFVLSVSSMVALLVFILWGYAPEEWYRYFGLLYYPDPYWAVAFPAWAMMLVAVLAGLYYARFLRNTPPLDDFRTITDSFAKAGSRGGESVLRGSWGGPADIPCAVVNRLLYSQHS
eukprot:RCo031739